MKKYLKYSFFYFLIKLFILLNLFNSFNPFSADELKIIELGSNYFRYVRFSFNSKGDMIVDTSSNPETNKRIFYGLKKNGRYYFKEQNGLETPLKYRFLTKENEIQKFEGESIFIKIISNSEVKEYILGTNKEPESFCELYNFENGEVISIKTKELFEKITSDVFSVMKLPEDTDSNYRYIFSFIRDDNFIIKKFYFDLSLQKYFESDVVEEFKCSKRNIVSSFFTIKFKYISFFHKDNEY